MTSYRENNQNILVCWLYSCTYHSQTWILILIIKINISNVKRWRRFISRTTATATIHCWHKMGSVGNCSGVLKRSAATVTTSHTTHRRNDELRNMFFKNNLGKIISLKNYNESQCKQNKLHPDATSWMMMISRNCNYNYIYNPLGNLNSGRRPWAKLIRSASLQRVFDAAIAKLLWRLVSRCFYMSICFFLRQHWTEPYAL